MLFSAKRFDLHCVQQIVLLFLFWSCDKCIEKLQIVEQDGIIYNEAKCNV